jgi:hypothetical protein
MPPRTAAPADRRKKYYQISPSGRWMLQQDERQSMMFYAARSKGDATPEREPMLDDEEQQLLTFLSNGEPLTMDEMREGIAAPIGPDRPALPLHQHMADHLEDLVARLIRRCCVELGKSADQDRHQEELREKLRCVEILPLVEVYPPTYPFVGEATIRFLECTLAHNDIDMGGRVRFLAFSDDADLATRECSMGKVCDFCNAAMPRWKFTLQCAVCDGAYDRCGACADAAKRKQLPLTVCHRHDVAALRILESRRRRDNRTGTIFHWNRDSSSTVDVSPPTPLASALAGPTTSTTTTTTTATPLRTNEKGKEKAKETSPGRKRRRGPAVVPEESGTRAAPVDVDKEEPPSSSSPAAIVRTLQIRLLYAPHHHRGYEGTSLEYEDVFDIRKVPAKFAAYVDARIAARTPEDVTCYSPTSQKRFFPNIAMSEIILPTRLLEHGRCKSALFRWFQ